MNQVEPPAENKRKEWPPWFEKWVIPYVTESILWPVLFALWAHLVMGLAVMMTVAYRSNLFLGLAGIFLLLAISGRLVWFEWEVKGRPGWVMIFLVCTWLAGGLTSYWGLMYNII